MLFSDTPFAEVSGELITRLRDILGADRVLSRLIDRIAYASDASFYRLIPQVIVRPSTVAEMRSVFSASHEYRVPITFRAAGTSLSGQAVTDGILVDISKTWNKLAVEDSGKRVRVQPGVVGQMVNEVLRSHGAKLGPDPASINACMIGGIIANNASGMCCGVAQNSYHTLDSLTFLLPNGVSIDTATPDADEKFHREAPEIANGLLVLQKELHADPELCERIRSKYLLKNTTGYSLNAFLDCTSAVQIMQKILVGSEGTLGFIAEAVFRTVPDLPIKYTGLLLFETIELAAAAIPALEASGAAALELMDRASLASIEALPGVPAYVLGLPDEACSILVEYQTQTESEIQEAILRSSTLFASLPLLLTPDFTRDTKQQAMLWKVRKGLFPAVGATKPRGSAVIIEDVAFPVGVLAQGVRELRILLAKYGFGNAILFGHAKEGNLHFVITPVFSDAGALQRYADFMKELANLVAGKFGGSLKAEHGTGRNIAPFVEQEWGREAYSLMHRLKQLCDPKNLLNPGVIINPDPECFIANIKDLPQVEEEVDRCIECGFCEPKCPSRNLTLSPRQRIVIRRELARLERDGSRSSAVKELRSDYAYDGLDTCAADGLCALACPVSIDTGQLVSRLRKEAASSTSHSIARLLSRQMPAVERMARISLRVGHLAEKIVGAQTLTTFTSFLSMIFGNGIPKWIAPMPTAAKALPSSEGRASEGRASEGRASSAQASSAPQAVYFPSCVTRTMGELPGENSPRPLADTLLLLSERAGIKMRIPSDVQGVCCGTPFSSKGFKDAFQETITRTVERCLVWSDGGALPIVTDTSPCAYKLRTCRNELPAELKAGYDKLTFLDSIEFAHDSLVPRLQISKLPGEISIHPVCSTQKMNLQDKLKSVCSSCTAAVHVPLSAGCCGFAGDRGMLVPELTKSALEAESKEVTANNSCGHYSSSRTCEIGLTRSTGKQYKSFLYLLEEASRPAVKQ